MPSMPVTQLGSLPVSTGIGLRAPHHAEWLRAPPVVEWLEAHTENYFHLDSPAARVLLQLRERYAVSLHGVGLSLGSTDPLDAGHLSRIRQLVRSVQPALVSEHLSWGSVDGRFLNDLLPMPYTSESLAHLIDRVDQVQEALGRQILIENISAYLRFTHSDIEEAQFLSELSRATGCGLLVDINNLYVNQRNHGSDARRFIDSIPSAAVRELHLAGHSINTVGAVDVVIDTHSTPVCAAVWDLFEYALATFGGRPTLIEWDCDLPALEVLTGEARKAEWLMNGRHDIAA